MSAAFTAVGSGDTYDPTSLAIVNELALAYSERREAIGQTAFSNITAGTDAHLQGTGFDSVVQAWLETYYLSFVDDQQAVGGNYDGQASIPPYNLAGWRTAAGLNANGFRRATAWSPPTAPTFAYGQIQKGDIKGPWIEEDLQAGLSALKWTKRDSTNDGDQKNGISFIAPGSCAAVLAAQPATWTAASWAPSSQSIKYRVSGALSSGGGGWTCQGLRLRHRAELTGVPDMRPCAVDVHYFVAIPSSMSGYTFEDIDSLGYAQDKFYKHETWGEDTSATRGGAAEPAAYIGDLGNPVPLSTLACPAGGFVGYASEVVSCVMKWNFTNA